jgi:hypothetical protein
MKNWINWIITITNTISRSQPNAKLVTVWWKQCRIHRLTNVTYLTNPNWIRRISIYTRPDAHGASADSRGMNSSHWQITTSCLRAYFWVQCLQQFTLHLIVSLYIYISAIIHGEKHKLWSYPLPSSLHPRVTSSPIVSSILPSTLSSNTLDQYFPSQCETKFRT